jgi:multisubunit Na+/H+ antiporter MnhF subunit
MKAQNISLFLQIIGISICAMLIKGGTTFDSVVGFPKCSWETQLTIVVFLIIAYRYARHIFLKQYNSDLHKERLGYVFKREEDKMSLKYFYRSLGVGFLAGCIGGMLGVGGSIILIPVWLDSGIDKDIATSSTAPLIFSSAFMSMFIALLCDMYQSFPLMIFYFVLAFLASFYVKSTYVLT